MNRAETAPKYNEQWFQGAPFGDPAADPEYEQLARRFLCGDVLPRDGLTQAQKALVILAGLTAGNLFPALRRYTRAALSAGATPVEIREAIYQCAPYVGLEHARCALEEVNAAFKEAGVSLPTPPQGSVTEEDRFEKGLDVQRHIFGREHIDAMRAAAPAETKHMQDFLSAHCFGDFYTRGALDLKMRELITFSAICALGGCEPQAKAHAAANISVGNSRETLIETATLLLPFMGFPRTLNALAGIDAATKP